MKPRRCGNKQIIAYLMEREAGWRRRLGVAAMG